eukprot:527888-Amphidinium_carterae.1
MFRDEVYAEVRVQHLLPLCRISEKLQLSLVLSDGIGQLRCVDDEGETTSHLMRNSSNVCVRLYGLFNFAPWM